MDRAVTAISSQENISGLSKMKSEVVVHGENLLEERKGPMDDSSSFYSNSFAGGGGVHQQ